MRHQTNRCQKGGDRQTSPVVSREIKTQWLLNMWSNVLLMFLGKVVSQSKQKVKPQHRTIISWRNTKTLVFNLLEKLCNMRTLFWRVYSPHFRFLHATWQREVVELSGGTQWGAVVSVPHPPHLPLSVGGSLSGLLASGHPLHSLHCWQSVI